MRSKYQLQFSIRVGLLVGMLSILLSLGIAPVHAQIGGFTGGLDAALDGSGPHSGKAYFFKGDQYVRWDWATDKADPGYPKSIAEWNLASGFTGGLDAALNGSGPYSGKAYFFKGDQYVRWDWATDKVDPGYPKSIAEWNLPSGFTGGFDAALNGGGPYSGKAYIFKGNQYVRFDWATDKVDPGYPKSIAEWNLPTGGFL